MVAKRVTIAKRRKQRRKKRKREERVAAKGYFDD